MITSGVMPVLLPHPACRRPTEPTPLADFAEALQPTTSGTKSLYAQAPAYLVRPPRLEELSRLLWRTPKSGSEHPGAFCKHVLTHAECCYELVVRIDVRSC